MSEVSAITHASAPPGHKCADCTMDGEACPACYTVWWQKRHPNVQLHGDSLTSNPEILKQVAARALSCGPQITLTLAEVEAIHAAAQSSAPETTSKAADQALKDFFSKYALGALARPSCLVCGKTPQEWPPGIQHAELPGIIVCTRCRDAGQRSAQETATDPPK